MRNDILTPSEAMRIEHWRKSFEDWVGIDNFEDQYDLVDWLWVENPYEDSYEIDWDGPKTKDAFITFYNRFDNDILAKQRYFFDLTDEETPLETLF